METQSHNGNAICDQTGYKNGNVELHRTSCRRRLSCDRLRNSLGGFNAHAVSIRRTGFKIKICKTCMLWRSVSLCHHVANKSTCEYIHTNGAMSRAHVYHSISIDDVLRAETICGKVFPSFFRGLSHSVRENMLGNKFVSRAVGKFYGSQTSTVPPHCACKRCGIVDSSSGR